MGHINDYDDGDGGRRLEVYPPIYRLGPIGKWIRGQFLKGIFAGTVVLIGIQKLRFPLLNKLMMGVSYLGEEEFYTLLIPMVTWLCEARLGRLLALLMAISFYITGFLKNLLCLPRPPSPPIIPLSRCVDWSLPSHHALLSVNIPWYIWFYVQLHYSAHLGSEVMVGVFVTICLWSFMVMFSRMYLGVHSPADIVTGGVVGSLLLASWLQVDLIIDHILSNNGTSSVFIYATVAMVMLYLHPDPPPKSYIYDETLALIGVAGGVVMGRVLGPENVMIAILEREAVSSWSRVTCSLLRVIIGLGVLLLAKVMSALVAKELLFQLCGFSGVPCVCIKRVSTVISEKVHYSRHFITLQQEPSQKNSQWLTERPLNLHAPIRLVSYVAMGIVGVAMAPCVFSAIGI